ncbi:MAG: phosphatidylglycerophosphatase A [Pseudomonadota bacterium]
MNAAGGIATLAGVGYLRPAPGTWGSLVACALAWAIHVLGGFWLLLAATIVAAFIGYFAIVSATRNSSHADPSEIVIDELVGQWIALWPVSLGAMIAGVNFGELWPGIVAAFVTFRLFDIWKPGPVGWADRQGGPFSVMLDDVIAGWMAALVVAVLAAVAHLPLL